jgi:hypothetical protein
MGRISIGIGFSIPTPLTVALLPSVLFSNGFPSLYHSVSAQVEALRREGLDRRDQQESGTAAIVFQSSCSISISGAG